MIRKLTGGRPHEFTERPPSQNGKFTNSEGIFEDLDSDSEEDEGVTRSNFVNGTSEDRAQIASSYKSAMWEHGKGGQGDEGGRNLDNGLSTTFASPFQPTLSLFSRSYSDADDDEGYGRGGDGGGGGEDDYEGNEEDEGDSDDEDDDEQVISDLERDSKGEFLDANEDEGGGGNGGGRAPFPKRKVEELPTDKYGFFIDPENKTGSAGGARTTRVMIPEKEKLRRAEVEKQRTTKWLAMIKDWDRVKDQKRTRNRIRKGVPDMVRGTVWNLLGNVKQVRELGGGARTEATKSCECPAISFAPR